MPVSFARPPVSEVVAGLVFLPRTDVLIPHFGEFWAQSLKHDYPDVKHAPPVAPHGEQPAGDVATGLPLPRLWFMSPTESRLVQLQQDRIYANWRQTGPEDQYIRYEPLREEAGRVVRLFDEYVTALTAEPLKAVRYEITYVNTLRQGREFVSASDLNNVFIDIGWNQRQRFLASPARIGARFEFELPDASGTLAVSLDPARMAGSADDVLRLQLAAVATVPVTSRIEFLDWLDVAHEQIVRGFKDLTTPAMHEMWGLLDEGDQQ